MTKTAEPSTVDTPGSLPACSYASGVALALLILGVTAAQITWMRRDAAPVPYPTDPYLYLMKAIRFADGLEWQGLRETWDAVLQLSIAGRPPLYQLLSVPFLLVLGRSLQDALLINVVFSWLLLLSVHATAKLLADRTAGLLAALLVAAYPPMIHLSHVYRPHFAVAGCAALSTWLLLRLFRDGSVQAAWLFVGSLAFGVLIHPNFVWVLAAPTALFGVYVVLLRTPPRRPRGLGDLAPWLLKKLGDPLVTRGLAPASLVAVAAPVAWYATGGQSLWRLSGRIAAAGSGSPIGFPEVPDSFWWYAATAPAALTNLLALLAAIGLAASLMQRRLPILLLGFGLAAGYTALSLPFVRGLVEPAWCHFLPLLPLAAVLTAVWIRGIGRPWLRRSLSLACVGTAAFAFAVVTWGLPARARPVALALGAPLDSSSCSDLRSAAFCPAPARNEPWRVSEILGAVVRDDKRCGRRRRVCTLFLVIKSSRWPEGGEWPRMTEALFSYHAVHDWPAARLRFTGYPGDLCGVGNFLISNYLFFFDPADDLRAGCFAVWSDFMRSPPDAFQDVYRRLATFLLPNGRGATLMKRTRALTPGEVDSIVVALRRRGALVRPGRRPDRDR